jgi:hypothetical protein
MKCEGVFKAFVAFSTLEYLTQHCIAKFRGAERVSLIHPKG